MKKYTEKDMVTVVNAAGEVQADQVPSAWVGTELLPEGTKKATKAQADKAEKEADASDDSENSES